MNRLIWHHTGGGYRPSPDDLRAYHRLIDRDGAVHQGHFPISANSPRRRLTPGTYAAHCQNLNGGSVGSSICAMKGAEWSQIGRWTHPILPVQVDALIRDSAEICLAEGIDVSRETTLSHAEVETTLGVDQRAKWDFDYPVRGGPGARDAIAIGDELRAELRRAITYLRQSAATPPIHRPAWPVLRQGATGDHVREVQRLLGGLIVDGQFGPRTRAAVVTYQREHELRPDGIVGPMTWAALTIT